MCIILRPPQIIAVNGPLVFLAGPSQGAPDWQNEAIRGLCELSSEIAITSPRNEQPRQFDYSAQVDWETHYLRQAASHGVILFWLAREVVVIPGRAYAQTTRFELAEWKVRHERDGVQLVIGIEKGFSAARYIRHRFGTDCPQVPIVNSLEQVCEVAVRLALRKSVGSDL